MQDKPVNQQRLSRDLASLPSNLKQPLVLPFLSAFWITIARQWGSIEALRLDKYLYLIRQYVAASFRYLSTDNWGNVEEIERYMEILGETPLSPGDKKVPNGMRYHVLDVYVDELERVGGDKWEVETLERLMGPVVKLQKESKDKAIRKAATETLDDARLKAWRGEGVEDAEMKEGSEGEEDEDAEWGGIED
jgi:ribosomal RNA-processing protein 1